MQHFRGINNFALSSSGVSPFNVVLKGIAELTMTQEIEREGVKYSKTHKFRIPSLSISPEPQELAIPADLYDAAEKSGAFRKQT
jgi:hypothetical protein